MAKKHGTNSKPSSKKTSNEYSITQYFITEAYNKATVALLSFKVSTLFNEESSETTDKKIRGLIEDAMERLATIEKELAMLTGLRPFFEDDKLIAKTELLKLMEALNG